MQITVFTRVSAQGAHLNIGLRAGALIQAGALIRVITVIDIILRILCKDFCLYGQTSFVMTGCQIMN